MNRTLLAVASLGSYLAWGAAVALGQAATIESLGSLEPANQYAIATGISDDGRVISGQSNAEARDRSFRWKEPGPMVALGTLNVGGINYAHGISGNGAVVVGETSGTAAFLQAFRWTAADGIVPLGSLNGASGASAAYAASRNGSVVVGYSETAGGDFQAFRWTAADGMTNLGTVGSVSGHSYAYDISGDGKFIVGQSVTSDGSFRAFRWTSSRGMGELKPRSGNFPSSTASAVSADGSVVVGYETDFDTNFSAFRWTVADDFEPLGTIGGVSGGSTASDVSEDGRVIVGSASTALPGGGACVWTDGEARSLYDMLANDYGLDLSDWETLDNIQAVSADGRTFAGDGTTADFRFGAFRVSLNHRPTATTPKTQTVECEGDENLVKLTTVVDDEDEGNRLKVIWKVDGVTKKTSTDIAPGKTVQFSYDYPDGESDVTVEVTDSYSSAKKSATVTVVDTTAPTVTVSGGVTVETDPGKDFATGVELRRPEVFDICDGDPSLRNNAPNRYQVGTTNVRWTATDADGNSSTATQKVRVEDRERPKIGSLSDVTIEIGGDASSGKVDLPRPSATDNVPDGLKVSGNAPSSFPIGTTTVTWTATDAAGNKSSKSQRVIVLRQGREERPNGALADSYNDSAYAYAYQSVAGSYSENSLYAYYFAYYALIYGQAAGDAIEWSGTQTRAQAAAEYAGNRYYQFLFAGYASDYAYAAYAATGDSNALYAYIFSLYTEVYAQSEAG